jgi:glycosyltransferase involved in cell wall biosynthesis
MTDPLFEDKPLKVLAINCYTKVNALRPEAELLLGLKRKGVNVDVVSPPDHYYPRKFKEADMRVYDRHPKRKFSWSFIKFVRQLIKEEDYDIAMLYNSEAIHNMVWAALDLPVKIVLYRGFPGNIHWWSLTSYLKYLHPRVDKIICITDDIKNRIDQQFFFANDKTVTIHKGHDYKWYEDVQPKNLTNKLGIPESAFVVALVANVRSVKSVPDLIKATHHLPQYRPFYFLLIGEGTQSSSLRNMIQESPYRDHIFPLGYQRNPLPWVAASDALVLPSVKAEATTKAVVEAMALQTTPVITDLPGNRPLVQHKKQGLTVPIRSPEAIARALNRLEQDREWNRQLAKNAQRHIKENFNIKDTIQQTLDLFRTLAQEKREQHR